MKAIGLTAAGAASALAIGALRPEDKPNIIFIMLDDLGKEWVGCYGSEEGLTPNVDRLAAEGVKFENVYSMPVCVPTRTTFLTGQYPARHGWTLNWNAPFYGIGHFDPDAYPSIARVLQAGGYATAAAGKWQLNDFRVQPRILRKVGFQSYCMWTGIERANVRLSQKRYWDPYIHTRGGSRTRQDQFGEDVFTSFLVRFMERNQKRPMFLYYPMCLPHAPLVTTPLSRPATADHELRRAMVYYADRKLGEIIDALEALKIRDSTIVVWTSDNGDPASISTMYDDRLVDGGKGTLKESGINVPFVMSCPGMIWRGTTSDALVDFTDLLPTLVELARSRAPIDTVLDGHSFARHALGEEDDGPRRWIMSMAPTQARLSPEGRLTPASSYARRVVRDKRYKLWIDEDRHSWQLVDLATDPEESDNLLDSPEPEHRQARARLERVVGEFAERDAVPRYEPLPPQPWDLPAEEAVRRFNEPKGA